MTGVNTILACEDVLPFAIEVRGQSLLMSYFVDADYSVWWLVPRCSHSDVLIFVNRAPILWCLTQQNTAEC